MQRSINLRPFVPGTPLHEFIHPSLIEDQHYTNLQGNLFDIPQRPLPKQLQLASATPIVTSRTPLTPSAPPKEVIYSEPEKGARFQTSTPLPPRPRIFIESNTGARNKVPPTPGKRRKSQSGVQFGSVREVVDFVSTLFDKNKIAGETSQNMATPLEA